MSLDRAGHSAASVAFDSKWDAGDVAAQKAPGVARFIQFDCPNSVEISGPLFLHWAEGAASKRQEMNLVAGA